MKTYYSCEDIAQRYGVKIITVWSWIRNKKLPAIKVGKQYSIRPEDLEKFEQERKTV